MTSSLVGSEMCIRDSGTAAQFEHVIVLLCGINVEARLHEQTYVLIWICLLYTSDAADDISV
eukprot:10646813-Prorocentrum_lima.AAC.1